MHRSLRIIHIYPIATSAVWASITMTSSLMLFVAAFIYIYISIMYSLIHIRTKCNESHHPSKLCRLSPAPPSVHSTTFIHSCVCFLAIHQSPCHAVCYKTFFFFIFISKTSFISGMYSIAVVIHFWIQQPCEKKGFLVDFLILQIFMYVYITNLFVFNRNIHRAKPSRAWQIQFNCRQLIGPHIFDKKEKK